MVRGVCAVVTLLLSVLRVHGVPRASATSAPLPSPPMVRCWCSSYPNVTLCSWPEPTHSPPTRYVATYRERHQQHLTKSCHLIPPGAPSSLQSSASANSSQQTWHCYLPNLKLLTDHIINITAVYPAGSSSYLSSFMLEDIVKPDPPINVRVSPKVRSLLVEWSLPPTWAHQDIFPLKYHIRYQRDNWGTPMFVNIGPFETTSVELRELRPGKPYLIQVCAKDLLGLGECSDWSEAVNVTIPKGKL